MTSYFVKYEERNFYPRNFTVNQNKLNKLMFITIAYNFVTFYNFILILVELDFKNKRQ